MMISLIKELMVEAAKHKQYTSALICNHDGYFVV